MKARAVAVLGFVLAACGGTEPSPRAGSSPAPVGSASDSAQASALAGPSASAPSAAAPSASAPSAAAGNTAPQPLRRSAVREVLAQGPAAFLRRIELEPKPVMRGGRFYGFRVARLTGDPAFWHGVDLRPGDVLVRVNQRPIEKPEDALALFKALDTASGLEVDYERNGAPRKLRYAIVEDGAVAR